MTRHVLDYSQAEHDGAAILYGDRITPVAYASPFSSTKGVLTGILAFLAEPPIISALLQGTIVVGTGDFGFVRNLIPLLYLTEDKLIAALRDADSAKLDALLAQVAEKTGRTGRARDSSLHSAVKCILAENGLIFIIIIVNFFCNCGRNAYPQFLIFF